MKVSFLGKQLRKEEFDSLMNDYKAFEEYYNNCSHDDIFNFYTNWQFLHLKSGHELIIEQHLEKQDNLFLNKVLMCLELAKKSKTLSYEFSLPQTAIAKLNTSVLNTINTLEQYIHTLIEYRTLQDKLSNIPVQVNDNKVQKL